MVEESGDGADPRCIDRQLGVRGENSPARLDGRGLQCAIDHRRRPVALTQTARLHHLAFRAEALEELLRPLELAAGARADPRHSQLTERSSKRSLPRCRVLVLLVLCVCVFVCFFSSRCVF